MGNCLELQRGQVSYEKIRRVNRGKGKIGCYYNNNENETYKSDDLKNKKKREIINYRNHIRLLYNWDNMGYLISISNE